MDPHDGSGPERARTGLALRPRTAVVPWEATSGILPGELQHGDRDLGGPVVVGVGGEDDLPGIRDHLGHDPTPPAVDLDHDAGEQ